MVDGRSSLGVVEHRVTVSPPSESIAEQPIPSLQMQRWAEQVTGAPFGQEALPVAASAGVASNST
jgi:hypothetical protein